ncbi:MAG: TolC family protein [Bacteroidales bacterium]|nr:TolC family protein [Bacteroidales bacterium]
MNNMYRNFFLSIGLILGIQGMAQTQTEPEVKTLSLPEVIEVAHEQSLMALMSRHQFRSSYWEFRTHKARYKPGLTLEGTVPSLTNATESVIQPDGTEEFVERSFMRTSLDLQLNQNIGLTGGRVFVSSQLQRNDNFGEDPPTNYLSYPVTIGFFQPINGYNQFKWDRKIEPIKYEEAKLQYINTMEVVSRQAVRYFFDLALAQINLEIAEKNMANNDTLFQIAKGRYQLGTIAENDLLQMELSFLNAGAAINEATIDLELRKSRLRSFLGFNERVSLKLTLPREVPDITMDYAKTLSEAKANNPEILGMERMLLEAERVVAEARSQKGIRGDLFAQFGLSGVDEDLRNSYTDLARQQRLEVGIQVPILDWGLGKGQYRMAQSAEEVVKTDVQQSMIDFDENVFLQVMQFNLQDDQVAIATKADTIADLRYEVTKQRFLIGKIDVLDLNVALEEKDVARRGYVQALRNYWDYYYDLRGLTLYDWQKEMKLSEDFDELLIQ